MYKLLNPTFVFIILFSFSMLAQDTTGIDQIRNLEKRLNSKLTVTQIAEILRASQKLGSEESKNSRGDEAKQIEIKLVGAGLRKAAFLSLNEKLHSSKLEKAEKLVWLNEFHDNAEILEELLKDVIELSTIGISKNSQLAEATFQYAWFLENYTPPQTGPVMLKDILARTRLSQELYLMALSLRKTLLSPEDDNLLTSKLLLANSYFASSDFEDCFTLLVEYTAAIEKKYGKSSRALNPALEMKSAISKMIDDPTNKVKGINIEDTSGNPTEMFLDISLRASNLEYKGLYDKGGFVKIGTAPSFSNDSITLPTGSIGTTSKAQRINAVRLVEVASFSKGIPVTLLIDELGSVAEARVHIEDLKTAAKIERNVKAWKFRPFSLRGKNHKMKGFIRYWIVK